MAFHVQHPPERTNVPGYTTSFHGEEVPMGVFIRRGELSLMLLVQVQKPIKASRMSRLCSGVPGAGAKGV